jgi:hypothetical protein
MALFVQVDAGEAGWPTCSGASSCIPAREDVLRARVFWGCCVSWFALSKSNYDPTTLLFILYILYITGGIRLIGAAGASAR